MTRSSIPIILDIEASGFGPISYPIEVGVVMSDGRRYCSLIKPIENWTHWDDGAAALHNISREQLTLSGKPVGVVCGELNDLLQGEQVYTDAWVVDKPWLDTLFYAAKMSPSFSLSPIESIQTECQHEAWDRVKADILSDYQKQRHRASADALLIQTIYRQSQ